MYLVGLEAVRFEPGCWESTPVYFSNLESGKASQSYPEPVVDVLGPVSDVESR